MREAFARWAKPGCNPVTQPPSEGLQEINNDISDVTLVTHVTLKKQQAQLCMGAGSVPVVEPDLSKNRVTRVTRVTCLESLDNICNPTRSARVTGLHGESKALTADEWAEAKAWPVETGRVFLAILRALAAQGLDYDPATVAAYRATKELMVKHGGPVMFLDDHQWAGLPPEAMPEFEATTGRLVAGGWEARTAGALAMVVVARRLGLPEPPNDEIQPANLADLETITRSVH